MEHTFKICKDYTFRIHNISCLMDQLYDNKLTLYKSPSSIGLQHMKTIYGLLVNGGVKMPGMPGIEGMEGVVVGNVVGVGKLGKPEDGSSTGGVRGSDESGKVGNDGKGKSGIVGNVGAKRWRIAEALSVPENDVMMNKDKMNNLGIAILLQMSNLRKKSDLCCEDMEFWSVFI